MKLAAERYGRLIGERWQKSKSDADKKAVSPLIHQEKQQCPSGYFFFAAGFFAAGFLATTLALAAGFLDGLAPITLFI